MVYGGTAVSLLNITLIVVYCMVKNNAVTTY
jgi:hypothetical protein